MKYSKHLFIRITYPILILLVFGLVFLLYVFHHDLKTRTYQVHTITGGLSIVQAIKAYRAETGVLPQSLDELVPKYLPSTIILRPEWGDSGWRYRHDDKGFSLTVGYKTPAMDFPLPDLLKRIWFSDDDTEYLYPEMGYSSNEDSWWFNS